MAISIISGDQTVLQLLKDVEEAFQDFVQNIQTECDPKIAELELSGTLLAVQEILETGGKALQAARNVLDEEAASKVEEVSSVYLNRALSIRTILDIEEDDTKQDSDPENKQEEDRQEEKQGDNEQVKVNQGDIELEQTNQGENEQVKDNQGEIEQEQGDQGEIEEEQDDQEDIEEEEEDDQGEDEQDKDNQGDIELKPNSQGEQNEAKKEVEKKKRKKKRSKSTDKSIRHRSTKLSEMLTLFGDVERTYSEQVRKLDNILNDETDPVHVEIRKTMKNLLKKTKKLARRSRKNIAQK